MRFKSARELMWALATATPDKQRAIIATMTVHDMAALDADFESWAHDNQLAPDGEGWRTWLMMAGRDFGKTRAGAEWIEALARSRPNVRIALVAATIDEARRVMVGGVSGVLSVAGRKKSRVKWEPGLGRLRWPNGSEAQLFSGDNPDGLRGPEHDFASGLRRGPRARALVTTTPRAGSILQRIGATEGTITTGGKTWDNINLDERFIETMRKTYGGTRLGLQELEGELVSDVEGSLWPRELIDRARVPVDVGANKASFDRILVGVDPPAKANAASDACGIVVCDSVGEALYMLEDASVQGLPPEGWANQVAAAALRWGAITVVAEASNGGAMVKSLIDAAGAPLKIRLVHASQGKSARAEPIALRFETGRAFFAGEFRELEAELGGMIAGGDYDGPGRSPDRADAMVWAMTALSETRSGVPRIRRM